MTTTKKQQEEPSTDYPETWLFDEHGETVAGTFVRFEQGMTKRYGPKPIAILEVDGAERSLWLNTTVLAGKFRDELKRRPEHELTVGERIVVTRLEERTTKDGETTYRAYTLLFPDRPEPSTSELFDLEDDLSRHEQRPDFQGEESPPNGRGQDDDVPF